MEISILEYMHFINLLVIQNRRDDLCDLLRHFYPTADKARIDHVIDFLFLKIDADHIEVSRVIPRYGWEEIPNYNWELPHDI